MITQVITANRPISHNIVQIRSDQSRITEKIKAQESQQNINADYQSQTQTFAVIFYPNMNEI